MPVDAPHRNGLTTIDGNNVGYRFVQGAFHGAVDMVYQPLAQVVDLGQALYGLARGGAYEPRWFSSIGQNYAGGMGYGETITRAVLGSNPVTGVGMASYDLTSSALQVVWHKAWAAWPEALLLASMVSVPSHPSQAHSWASNDWEPHCPMTSWTALAYRAANCPPLPASATNTFDGTPVARKFEPGQLNRVYQDGNRKASIQGRYWATETPTSEAMWRGPYAVLKDWGNAGTDIATLQRPNTWAWYGKTAPMAVPRHSFTVGQHAIGWYQPGGAPQAMIPNSFSIVNPGNVTTARTPWHKP